jgi:hypothetical protein
MHPHPADNAKRVGQFLIAAAQQPVGSQYETLRRIVREKDNAAPGARSHE